MRYQPSDFHKLTNRRNSCPYISPDSALEPPPAEYTNGGRIPVSADKRPIDIGRAADSPGKAQASRQSGEIRKGSWSSVKEDEGGKL